MYAQVMKKDHAYIAKRQQLMSRNSHKTI